MHVTPVTSSETLGTSRVQNMSSWCWLWSAKAPWWSRTDSLPSGGRARNVPYNTGWSVERCTSQVAFTCVRVILCMLTCSPLCRAGSCTKECMQVLARREMCEYKWSLYFQKWSIVLRINGKLDHPVIACNCIPCEYTQYSTFSGMGLWFLRWWLWKGLSFLSVYFSKPIRNFKTRRCFSRSYDTFS